jgi:phage head maturation protease
MTDQLVTAQLEDAVELLEAADGGDRRTLRLRLLRYGEVGNLETGPELLEAGAFAETDPTRVTIEAGRHGGPLVGVGTALEEVDGVPYLEARVSRTRDGDELLELARDGVLRAASIVYRPMPGASRRRADGVSIRRRVELVRVAVLERGAFPSAEVVAASEASQEDRTMPELTLDQITDAVRGIVTDAIPAPVVSVPAPADRRPTLAARAPSFSDVLEASLSGDVELVAEVAASFMAAAAPTELVDGVTADVPSIVRPAWLDKLVGLLPAVRPVVTAFGTAPLPDSGMEFSWPVLAEGLDGRVAEQAAEKDVILSKKVTLTSDKATIKTIAGGLDMSWQVLRRSSPSYREIVLRILAAAWATETDKAFGAAIIAKGTGTGSLAADADGVAVHAALLEASAKVDDATGSPATFVLAAPDAWLTIAKASGLLPPVYGVQNVPGVAQASTLRVDVSGLPIIRARNLAAGTIIVSNSSAAACHSSGMMTATQDVVAQLGTDVAIWSLEAPAIYIPTGIVKVTAASGA